MEKDGKEDQLLRLDRCINFNMVLNGLYTWRIKTMLYTRKEIRDYWKKYPVFTPGSLILNPFFILYKTESISEAIVVAAVFMSELSLPVEDTGYDKDKELLYMNYSNYPRLNEAKKLTRDAMEYVMDANQILDLTDDSYGLDLFKYEYNNFMVIA